MDDFNNALLTEAKCEYSIRLVNILSPYIVEGFKSIFDDAVLDCEKLKQPEKYLMTFQNYLTKIPKWNNEIIDKETDRIIRTSGCNYLKDLLTCVHIIQLKIMTTIRVGKEQKKIDIDIPSLSNFIHKCYINCARKIYSTVYLYQSGLHQLQTQMNNHKLKLLIDECILDTVRDNIPIEEILKSYLYETIEEDVSEEITEVVEDKPCEPVSLSLTVPSVFSTPKPVEEKNDILESIKKMQEPTPEPDIPKPEIPEPIIEPTPELDEDIINIDSFILEDEPEKETKCLIKEEEDVEDIDISSLL